MSYSSIKELVLDNYVSNGSMPDYESLTAKVIEYFPTSKWQKSHYSWYKSQINTGRIQTGDTELTSYSLEEIDENISESIEFGVSLERDLQKYLSYRVSEIEQGLVLENDGIEYSIESGRIDLLAKDHQGNLVVIELKAGKAGDAALGQLLGYIGNLASKEHIGSSIRGILVASDFEPRVVYATKNLTNIKLYKYSLEFKFDNIS